MEKDVATGNPGGLFQALLPIRPVVHRQYTHRHIKCGICKGQCFGNSLDGGRGVFCSLGAHDWRWGPCRSGGFSQLPIYRLPALGLEIFIGGSEMPAAEKAPVGTERRGMRRL